jgi:hypothetical protein
LIALKTGHNPRTVGKWLNIWAYQLRQSIKQCSKPDSFKPSINLHIPVVLNWPYLFSPIKKKLSCQQDKAFLTATPNDQR